MCARILLNDSLDFYISTIICHLNRSESHTQSAPKQHRSTKEHEGTWQKGCAGKKGPLRPFPSKKQHKSIRIEKSLRCRSIVQRFYSLRKIAIKGWCSDFGAVQSDRIRSARPLQVTVVGSVWGCVAISFAGRCTRKLCNALPSQPGSTATSLSPITFYAPFRHRRHFILSIVRFSYYPWLKWKETWREEKMCRRHTKVPLGVWGQSRGPSVGDGGHSPFRIHCRLRCRAWCCCRTATRNGGSLRLKTGGYELSHTVHFPTLDAPLHFLVRLSAQFTAKFHQIDSLKRDSGSLITPQNEATFFCCCSEFFLLSSRFKWLTLWNLTGFSKLDRACNTRRSSLIQLANAGPNRRPYGALVFGNLCALEVNLIHSESGPLSLLCECGQMWKNGFGEKMWIGSREIGGKLVNLFSWKRLRVAHKVAGCLGDVSVWGRRGFEDAVPLKKDPKDWARNAVSVVWSVKFRACNRPISEWSTMQSYDRLKVSTGGLLIARADRKYPDAISGFFKDSRWTSKFSLFVPSPRLHSKSDNQ